MKTITARNVNAALSEALWWLHKAGIRGVSRNGVVIRAPDPVITKYTHPWERVLFCNLRDANPFFHMLESLWMLGGYNGLEFPAQFAKQIREYSDDGATLNGAYGYRWRHYFGYDQLGMIVAALKNDPNTRRAVLTMWDAQADPDAVFSGAKDVPCNTHIYFSAVSGVLDMTVCCRSNDAVWGAYGANAVHFSMLQQFIAEQLGMPMGAYYQFSNNLHVYADRPDVGRLLNTYGVDYYIDDRYSDGDIALPSACIQHTPLMQPQESAGMFIADIHRLVWHPYEGCQYATEFFTETIKPMQVAHRLYTLKRYDEARDEACGIKAQDWMMACVDWLDRRETHRDKSKA